MHFDFMHVSKNQKTIVSILLVFLNAFHALHFYCIVIIVLFVCLYVACLFC